MKGLSASYLEELLEAVGAHLTEAQEEYSVIVVGGASLSVLGFVQRTTEDVDILALVDKQRPGNPMVDPQPLPRAFLKAIAIVARDYSLPENWINSVIGAQLNIGIPPFEKSDIEWRQYGALEVGFAGRKLLIPLKLFAAVDQGPNTVHAADLIALSPTDIELENAASWVKSQDAADEYGRFVDDAVKYVRDNI